MTDNINLALNIIEKLIYSYLTEEEDPNLSHYLADDFQMVSSDNNTLSYNKQQFLNLFNSRLSTYFNVTKYEITKLTPTFLSDSICSIIGSLAFTASTPKSDFEINLKFSFLCRLQDHSWKILLFHHSIPTKEKIGESLFSNIICNFNNLILEEELISKTKSLEKLNSELQASEARYKFAMEATNDLVFEFDLENNIFSVDRKKFSKVYGFNFLTFDINDLLEQICSIIHPDDFNSFKALFSPRSKEQWQELDLNPISLDYRIKDPTGLYRWSEITIIPIADSKGVISKLVGNTKSINDIKIKEAEILRLARKDPLTDLLNRIETEIEINNHFIPDNDLFSQDQHTNDQNYGVLMLIDVDDFKSINDTYGHLVGDSILKITAERIKSCARNDDIVGRIGGDEFIVYYKCNGNILKGNTIDTSFINKKSTEILNALRKPFEIDNIFYNVSVTIGIASAPVHGTTYNELVECADKALYLVKRNGKNSSLIYSA